MAPRVLIGLAAGFGVGLAIAGSASVPATTLLAVITPVGIIFINLIRMTALPLVASMLVASVGSIGESRALGRTGGRALAIALVLLTLAAVASALLGQPVLGPGRNALPATEALPPP